MLKEMDSYLLTLSKELKAPMLVRPNGGAFHFFLFFFFYLLPLKLTILQKVNLVVFVFVFIFKIQVNLMASNRHFIISTYISNISFCPQRWPISNGGIIDECGGLGRKFYFIVLNSQTRVFVIESPRFC